MSRRVKVILWSRIAKLGSLGDEVSVAAGYARNYLFPLELAQPSTPEVRKVFRERKEELLAKSQDILDQAQGRAMKLQGTSVSISVPATETGKLYGSIAPQDIVNSIDELDLDVKVEKKEVNFSGGPIRELGEFTVDLILHPDVTQKIEVTVERGN